MQLLALHHGPFVEEIAVVQIEAGQKWPAVQRRRLAVALDTARAVAERAVVAARTRCEQLGKLGHVEREGGWIDLDRLLAGQQERWRALLIRKDLAQLVQHMA